MWCFILYASIENTLFLKLAFFLSHYHQHFYIIFFLTDDGEDDDSDSHAEMVTIFSLSISFHLSIEGSRRKGDFTLFWGNLGSWLDSVAWERLIIDLEV